MCDPHRRGKLTRHGWRVAYHLARSVKTRGLDLPATLPLCLYPQEGRVKPEVKGEEARAESSRAQGERGAAAAGELGGVGNGQGKGSALANMGAEHCGAAASSAAGPPTGGRKKSTKKQKKKSNANDDMNGGEAKGGGGVEQEEDSAAYRMSDRERARYDKTFKRLLKGSSGKNVGGKEVRAAMHTPHV